MSLITAQDLAKSYAVQDVFQGVSLAIPHQGRIALVGPNGVGKSTLLRLLAGLEQPDQGRVFRARGLRIGYLPQESSFTHPAWRGLEISLWESCLEVYQDLREQEAELARLEAAMADPRRAEEAMARYGPLQEAFELAGGFTYPYQIRRVLNGLGFEPADYDRPLEQLSGGQRTRAAIARLLLEDPGLLVLDEPTNHLDIGAVEWLEGWLRDWPGAAVIVSHDRYFLDRTVDAVWELTVSGLEMYHGDYTAYTHQRAERRSFQEAQYRAQQAHIRREGEFIRRYIAGQRTRQAQGRRKRLERQLREEAIVPPGRERTVDIRFEGVGRSGDRVLETEALAIGYADTPDPLFRVPDLVLTRGECAALIGPNGAGKTTFLKTLLGEVQPYEGIVRLGAGLHVGYFAQAHEDLDVHRTVLEEVLRTAPDLKPSQARDLLARFLFRGDDVSKPIAVLSGGERGRVALAKLTLEGANLLLLDEPTNHLDIPSQEVLEASLTAFPGTILLVSHDRYLIDALATQIWVISPEGRELEVFPYGYAEYLEERQRRKQREADVVERPIVRREPAGRPSARVKADLRQVELQIEALERELAQVAREIEAVGEDYQSARQLGDRYATLEADLEAQLAIWERLARGEAEGYRRVDSSRQGDGASP